MWWVPDEPAAPAAPLKRLVGMLDAEEAERFEQRTGAVRERFDREVFGEEPGRERGEGVVTRNVSEFERIDGLDVETY
ncbi:hypothetical protein BRC90_04685 [Halobacteriales archaeon QS_4_69_34]|nr:MAG: hypothetical protein BRC90_04685 [Halobacteriales archaeon QS_4_69_34]